MVRRAIRKAVFQLPSWGPKLEFRSFESIRLNQRRLEHLVSLNLSISGQRVLEVGAGIGAHTSFFLDRACKVVATEGRPANLRVLRQTYPDVESYQLDLDRPDRSFETGFDIVYCYGVLYHLRVPDQAISYMAKACSGMLLLETCVSPGDSDAVNPCDEPTECPSQALSGQGCRPTRKWVFNQLKQSFAHVYMPVTQPFHEDFPLDWEGPDVTRGRSGLCRAVFIASRAPIQNELLVEELPAKQSRQV